tara:strand:- start:4064 stop:8086 length:4023 start_codon:yes stop_codon:yes gene_type:complete
MAATAPRSDFRNEHESRLYHERVAARPKHYLRVVDNNFEDGDDAGIPLPPGTRILTWVMPRLLWQMGVVSFSQAMCSKSASKMVSFLHWMLDAAHTAGARVLIETLVDRELWDAAVDIVAESDRRTAQHTAVEGYRIFIICSRIQMATFCNTLMTALQRELSVQTTTLVKGRRKERDLEDLGPGVYCVDPRRIASIEEARLAILQINGVVKDNSIDPKDPVTLEFDASLGTTSNDDAANLVFNETAIDDAEPDIGDAPGAPAESEVKPEDESLPKDHLFYPLLWPHSMETTVAQMWREQNNIPELQTSKDNYVFEADDGAKVFRPPLPELIRTVEDPLKTIQQSTLPEFWPDINRRVRWLEQQLAAIGVYVSLRDMTDAEKEKVLRKRIVNPADCTPIAVDPADYNVGTEDPRMKKHYPVLVSAMRKTLMVRKLYAKNMDVYLNSYIPKVRRMLYGTRIPGVPTYLYKIEEEQRALQTRVGPNHLDKSSRLVHKLITGYPALLAKSRGFSFSSFWIREMVYLLGELMGLTHTQMLVLLLIFPLMSRVGMINFKWPAPFVVVTSEPGVGKSEMMRGYQASIHASRLYRNGGPSTGQGAIFAHIEGQVACYDEGLSSDTLTGNAGAAFKEALESRQTSMTRQVPTGNGIYTQRTEVYRNQGGYLWLANKRVTGALGDRAVQVSAGVLSGSDQERQSTSERVAGPSRPSEYTAATMILQMLDGHGNRFDQLFLAGALQIDTTMHHVMISVAYTLLGMQFSKRLRVREVAQLLPGAIGHRRMQLAAQWFGLTSQRLPSTNVRSEDMDRLEEQFLLYNSYLTHEDVCRTLWMLTEINMTEQVRMDVVAALRAMVVYDESCSPKLASHDRRYYETTMASNDSTAVVSLTNGRHGPATIIQTLKELRETQYCGAPVVTTVKNIYHVQAAYVHRPQVQTRITKLIFAALREVFNSSVYRHEWALTYDTEDQVVFSANVLRLFCDINQRVGAGHHVAIDALGSTDRDTLERELGMMALSKMLDYKTSYTSVGQLKTASVGILDDVEQAPPNAQPLLENGGYSQLVSDPDAFRKTKRLWNQVLIVPLDSLLNADMVSGANVADDIQDVIVQTMAISGCMRKGDVFYEGLHAAGGGASVSITFTESMLEAAKAGLTLKHLNYDRRAGVASTKVHLAGWEKAQTDPTEPFWDVVFPRSSSHVRMPQLMCGNIMSVGRAIEENHARHMCGQLAPPHFRSYAAYPSIEITVIHPDMTFTFYLSERSPDPVADALYYVDQTLAPDDWFLLGRCDGAEVHLSLKGLFDGVYDSNEFDLVYAEDPLAADTQTSKRVLSAFEQDSQLGYADSPKRPRA